RHGDGHHEDWTCEIPPGGLAESARHRDRVRIDLDCRRDGWGRDALGRGHVGQHLRDAIGGGMTDHKAAGEMLTALGKPFPQNAIKKRQGGGGRMFDYVETHTVIHRLNSATNGEWSFYVKDVQWRSDLLIVLGELTIPGLGTRSGFGVQKVSDRGGED